MSHAIIRKIFEQALSTWATANSQPVQWQNVILEPEPAAYVRAFLIPDDTEAPDVERVGRTYTGLFQVTILRPLGEGSGASDALAASLSAVFTPAAPLTGSGLRVTIRQPLSQAAPLIEQGHFAVPCSVPYSCTTY